MADYDGPCAISSAGSCILSSSFSFGQYGNDEQCTFTVHKDTTLIVEHFDVESHPSCEFDSLQIWQSSALASSSYCGNGISEGPNEVNVHAGDQIRWTSDSSVTGSGFKICPELCAAGTFSATDGQSTLRCISCPEGKFSVAGATSCDYISSTCPAGTYSENPAACRASEAGTYGTSPGKCTECPPGKFTTASNSA